MTFTSSIFLIGLLPWFILLFSCCREKVTSRKFLIFSANSIFYIWGGAGAFVTICMICVVTWLFCRISEFKKSKLLLYMGCVVIVTPLLVMKYTSFILENLNCLLGYNLKSPEFLIPIGISFVTFEALACFCDVYKGKVEARVTFVDMYLYLTFFPTVTSGPIMRIEQFKRGYEGILDMESYTRGIEKIVCGLCKKTLVADKISSFADYYFDGIAAGNQYTCIGLWIGSITYTLQLYFDFSGYSDMAVGIGTLLGFSVPENFHRPYQARSIQDFWKRWHISLSLWFRDYIYVPLGGNRCSVLRHIVNMLVVWLLTGIWHGADWTFVVWSLGYFILLVIEKYVPVMKKVKSRWFTHIYTLFFVNLLWVPFRAYDLNAACKYIGGMFGIGSRFGIEEKTIRFLPYLIIVIVICMPWQKWLAGFKKYAVVNQMTRIMMILLAVTAVCAVINSSYTPYIYGDF